MAAGFTSYSDKVKKNLKGRDKGTLSFEGNEEKYLVDKIHKLRKAIPIGYDDLKSTVDDIAQTADTILVKNYEDREKKQKEISQLRIRVSNLERQVAKLQRNVDIIDAGEAMKIIEIHVALFVLPLGEEIASIGAFDQVLEYMERSNSDTTTWDMLRTQCDIKWTDKHLKTKEHLIGYRNVEAHHKRFDLAQLRAAMIKRMPHRAQHCEDFVNLFEKVNSLMKFGILASEFVVRDVIRRRCSKAHIDLINAIKRKCYRNVQYLQDIEMKEAREHLVQYFPERDIYLWDDIISVIENTNRPRLGKLVKEKEMEIVSVILQHPATLTFDQMKIFLAKGERSSREKAELWNELTDGKGWSKDHNEAMTELKKLLPDNQSKTVDSLRIDIAQLHIADFLDKDLWVAGSDILEIFVRWEKTPRKFKT